MRLRSLPLLAALTAAAATGSVVVATTAQAGGYATPSFVFTSTRGGDDEILVRYTDGRTVQLTHNAVGDFGAVWSPDGRRLAFSREFGGGTALFVMRADGTGVRRVTTPATTPEGAPSFDVTPAWSPDGTRLAFASNRAGIETDVWRVDVDGTHLVRLTDTPPFVGDGNPAWSPDGRWIWFDSDRVNVFNREVYRMRPDGSGVQRMTTTGNVDDGAPDVSPDGRRIVFTSQRATATQDLFTMNADGTGVRPLGTPSVGRDEVAPRWSADGARVLYWRFASVDDPTQTIWVIDADGTDRRRLTPGRFLDSDPDPYPVRVR
jgi:Tol biopolymer transport system component